MLEEGCKYAGLSKDQDSVVYNTHQHCQAHPSSANLQNTDYHSKYLPTFVSTLYPFEHVQLYPNAYDPLVSGRHHRNITLNEWTALHLDA